MKTTANLSFLRDRAPSLLVAVGLALCVLAVVVAAAAGGTAAFRGDLEQRGSGWLGLGWDSLQHEPDRPVADSFQLVTSPVRQGSHAARIVVRHGYSKYGYNEDTELVFNSKERSGDDYFYAWSTLFPLDWRAPYKWGIFAQWHATLGTSPAVSFGARGDTVHLGLLAGKTDEKANRFEFSRRVPLLSTLSKGRWNDFVLRVRWSGRNNGIVEVWHRVAGSGGFEKKVSLSGITTLQYATARGQSPDNPSSIYVLWGLYRGSYCSKPTQLNCTGPLGTQAPSVLYQDGFARGTSFDQVAVAAFGDSSVSTAPTSPPPTSAQNPTPKSITEPATEPRGIEATKLQPVKRLVTIVDSDCRGCRVIGRGSEVQSHVAGGADGRDTAYRLMAAGGRAGVSGPVKTRVSLRLAADQRISRNLAVFQLRDVNDAQLYELYVAGADRTLRLWSPPGGLSRTAINVSTGVVVPNDGRSRLAVEISTRPGRSVVVSVDGVARARVSGLSGGTAAAPRYLRVGIDHYDASSTEERVSMFHSRLELYGPK